MQKNKIIIITSCTNRKRKNGFRVASIHSIARGNTKSVAKRWTDRVWAKGIQTQQADQLYVGRSFTESLECKRITNGRLFIVSAGLGLIEDTASVPAYNLTVVGTQENVAKRIIGEDFSPRSWWAAITQKHSRKKGISDYLKLARPTLVCIALPSTYLDMVAADLGRIPKHLASRIRVFSSKDGLSLLPDNLKPSWMPYDDRLDGPNSKIPGTKADFAQRAMHHFLESFGVKGRTNPSRDATLVTKYQKSMKRPRRHQRTRKTDAEIIAIMKRDFNKVGGSTTRMLPHLRRKLGIACEQGRCSRLFNNLKASLKRRK